MDLSIMTKQGILFAHLVLFAFAIAAILREDIRMLFADKIDTHALVDTGLQIKWLLIGLWCTGLILIALDVGLNFALVLAKPKLLTKIIVVVALTFNGALLHLVAFPMLTGGKGSPRQAATAATILGSISTVSWSYASFVGSARIIQPYFSFAQFMALYVIAVCLAVSIGLLFVRDRIEQLLIKSRSSETSGSEAEGRQALGRDAAISSVGLIARQNVNLVDEAA